MQIPYYSVLFTALYANCLQAKPTHTCTCNAGLSGNGKTGKGGTGCTETDGCKNVECARLTGNNRLQCADNKAPLTGFTCPKCPSGYDREPVSPTATGAGGWCRDTNGCTGNPCDKQSKCTDKKAPQTGYTCAACNAGYTGDGHTCTDINDCATNPCGSGALTCTNKPGTKYKCICKPGYTPIGQPNRQSCVLTNACRADEDDCMAEVTPRPHLPAAHRPPPGLLFSNPFRTIHHILGICHFICCEDC